MDVGLTQVAPYGEIREAQDQRMFRHNAMSNHVFVNITTTVHLRTAEWTGETVQHHQQQVRLRQQVRYVLNR